MTKKSNAAESRGAAATMAESDIRERLFGVRNEFAHQIEALVLAGFQSALVTTAEHTRMDEILGALSVRLSLAYIAARERAKAAGTAQPLRKRPGTNKEDDPTQPFEIVHWNAVNGFSRQLYFGENRERVDAGGKPRNMTYTLGEQAEMFKMSPTDPVSALKCIPLLENLGVSRNAFVIMHDYHYAMASSTPARSLLQIMTAERAFHSEYVRHFVVFQQNSLMWPTECEHCVRRVELPLPDDAGMAYAVAEASELVPAAYQISETLRPAVIRGLRGLGARAADDVLALSYIERENFADEEVRDARTLEIVERYKAEAIRTDGLTYVPREQIADINEICGYEAFIDTLKRGANAYRADAKAAKIDTPRGYVLIGVPGSGKSQIAYAAARAMDMPLIMFDPSQMLGSLVGQTEQRVREAFRTIEAQRGCVVVIDELDKMLVTSNGSSDGGVSMRMFGMILRWLQERRDESIVIVTLNRTSGIDPELFRSGRFDGTYGVGLPDDAVRRQILEVHFAKRGVSELLLDPDEWDHLSAETDGLLGSDMEEIVKVSRAKALQRLLDSNLPVRSVVMPSFRELMAAVKEVKDQSITRLEANRVEEVCKFVKERCRSVCYPPGTPKVRTSARRALSVGQPAQD